MGSSSFKKTTTNKTGQSINQITDRKVLHLSHTLCLCTQSGLAQHVHVFGELLHSYCILQIFAGFQHICSSRSQNCFIVHNRMFPGKVFNNLNCQQVISYFIVLWLFFFFNCQILFILICVGFIAEKQIIFLLTNWQDISASAHYDTDDIKHSGSILDSIVTFFWSNH